MLAQLPKGEEPKKKKKKEKTKGANAFILFSNVRRPTCVHALTECAITGLPAEARQGGQADVVWRRRQVDWYTVGRHARRREAEVECACQIRCFACGTDANCLV